MANRSIISVTGESLVTKVSASTPALQPKRKSSVTVSPSAERTGAASSRVPDSTKVSKTVPTQTETKVVTA